MDVPAPQTLVQSRPAHGETRFAWLLLCVALVILVSAADFATGYDISLSVLYLAPVCIAAWVLGLQWGVGMAVFAIAAWYVTFAGANPYSHPVYFGWEALVRASTLVIFAIVIHRLRLALARSDERFVTVLEGLDAAVYVSAGDTGKLMYMNERSRRAFGHVRTLADLETRFGDGVPHAPVAAPATQREVCDRAAGRWYLVNQRSIRWVDGGNVILHMATDITQRKEAERLAQDRQERLEMTSRLVTAGEMASTLAHELNQPLASVLNYNTGCVELLRSGVPDIAQVLEGLEKSSEQAERAGAVLQQVRDFIARREPQFARCELGEVMREGVRLIGSLAARHEVEIELDASPVPVEVDADRVMLQQLVLNLAKNAIEAIPDTNAVRRLTLRWRCTGTRAELEIEDTGTGLPAELADNLFVPFFSTKPGGMGLGLHICRSIAEHHEGQLSASHASGAGTVFHFSFPAIRS